MLSPEQLRTLLSEYEHADRTRQRLTQKCQALAATFEDLTDQAEQAGELGPEFRRARDIAERELGAR